MKFSIFSECEVINVRTCKKLGCVSDIWFDCCTGKIETLIIPGPCRFLGFFSPPNEYQIPFCQIRHIGPDVILVDVCEEEILVERKNSIHI